MQNVSPMFRSMYSQKPPSALTGLLLSGAGSEAPQPPSMPSMATDVDYSQNTPSPTLSLGRPTETPPVQSSGSPSRAQFISRPAQPQYAKTPAPAAQPSSVWRSPSANNMNYRNATSPFAATLLDGPQNSVVGGFGDSLRDQPAGMPPPPVPAAGPVAMEDRPPPLPQVEMLARGGNDALPPQRVPDFLDLLAYQPLQPTRRYEVL